MKVLAIECSTDACSCALLAGERLVERHAVAPRRHASLVLEMVGEVLEESGETLTALHGVGLGRGPGSFTGVRIATGVAQGLAFAACLPVVPVSSLLALAQVASDTLGIDRVLVAADARMGEVYAGAFERAADGLLAAVDDERVCAPAALPMPPGEGWVGVGSGFTAHRQALVSRLGGALGTTYPDLLPSAAAVAAIAARGLAAGVGVAAQEVMPAYLRDRVTRA